MSNQLAPWEKLKIDENVYSALKNSLYTGAAEDSIMMVVSYCKARKLDPMLKPVHIVPMYVTDKSKPKNQAGYYPKSHQDVIMPGIGLYRIQAARTGEYAGMTEPEFGEDITQKLGSRQITYPKWCKITVKRRSKDGHLSEWTAKEFWIENYANKSDDPTPNAMWSKRPYAQLAKCAEAQALRKAFPEIGSQPTAEEMEGKHLDDTHYTASQKTNQSEILEKKINEDAALSYIPMIEEKEHIKITEDKGEISKIGMKINNCQSRQELESISSEINALGSFLDKKELIGVYKNKMDEFNKI